MTGKGPTVGFLSDLRKSRDLDRGCAIAFWIIALTLVALAIAASIGLSLWIGALLGCLIGSGIGMYAAMGSSMLARVLAVPGKLVYSILEWL